MDEQQIRDFEDRVCLIECLRESLCVLRQVEGLPRFEPGEPYGIEVHAQISRITDLLTDLGEEDLEC